jgi:DNA-binding MarR family transcriptional regulator
MTANPKAKTIRNLASTTKKADHQILQLFPSLNFSSTNRATDKTVILQRLTCLKIVGCSQEYISASDLSRELGVSRSEANKAIKGLVSLSLVKAEKKKKTVAYSITTVGFVALMAFDEFRDWGKIKSVLAVPQKKNDPLAYALLVIGFCAGKPDSVYQALTRYASQGNIIENIPADISAESLLSFYRQELRAKSPLPPVYLSVFKEFTTAGFQEVFRMLLVAVKPTAEDYNWLIEFFNEVSEFYFDPSRIAFVNLLPENQNLRLKLEEFKKAQDQQIKKQGENLEVTFTIPGSDLSKIDSMPPHLRAIGMRLILEPIKFINKELVDFFWTN